MSTVQRVNFEPISNLLNIERRDFPLADKTLVNPLNTVALVDGEWMKVNDANQAVRASDVATPGDPATGIAMPLWMQRNSLDNQAMSARKVALITTPGSEWETRVFDSSVAVGSGAAITANGQPLKVATVTIGGRNYCGLVGSTFNDNANIVGYVTRLPSTNGGKLRFRFDRAVRNGTT